MANNRLSAVCSPCLWRQAVPAAALALELKFGASCERVGVSGGCTVAINFAQSQLAVMMQVITISIGAL